MRQAPIGPLLFATWLVAVAGVINGVALPLATLVAFVLTILFLNPRDRTDPPGPQSDPGLSNPSSMAGGSGASWSRAFLPRIRALRRRTRRGQALRLTVQARPSSRPAPIGEPKLHPFEAELPPPAPLEDEEARWSGVLHLLALASALLTGVALLFEIDRMTGQKGYLDLFTILDVLGVLFFPLLIGFVCRCGAHSILAMLALSAAIQAILFRLTGSAPDWLILPLAAVTLPGVPLGLALFPDRIDRRCESRANETTTGRLLRGKRRRGKRLGSSVRAGSGVSRGGHSAGGCSDAKESLALVFFDDDPLPGPEQVAD